MSSNYKDTFVNLLVKTQFTEEKDKEREYDYEGDMAMSQLKSVINNAQKLHDMLEPDTNLPEWVQLKITLAEDYIVTAANYMEGESDEDLDEEVEQIAEGPSHLQYSGYVNDKKYTVHIPSHKDLGDYSDSALHKKLSNENPHLEPHEVTAIVNSGGAEESHEKVSHEGKEYTHHVLNRQEPRHIYEEVDQMDEVTGYEGVKNRTDIIKRAAAMNRMGKDVFLSRVKKRAVEIKKEKEKEAAVKEEVGEVDEARKMSRVEWRMGTQDTVDANNYKIFKKLSATDPKKAQAFHDNLLKMKKKDVKEEKGPAVKFPKYYDYKKAKAAVKEEVRYFSGTTVSGKAWKFIPPDEPKMLSPEFVKDRVPTLTDKEAHEVSVVAKDQYNDVDKKFAEMSEGAAGTVPKTAKEKALAAKAHPKNLITHKDVLIARGVKLSEDQLRAKIRDKIGGKTLTKKPADPIVFHPVKTKKPT